MDGNATEQEKATAYLVYEFERRAYPLSDAPSDPAMMMPMPTG